MKNISTSYFSRHLTVFKKNIQVVNIKSGINTILFPFWQEMKKEVNPGVLSISITLTCKSRITSTQMKQPEEDAFDFKFIFENVDKYLPNISLQYWGKARSSDSNEPWSQIALRLIHTKFFGKSYFSADFFSLQSKEEKTASSVMKQSLLLSNGKEDQIKNKILS